MAAVHSTTKSSSTLPSPAVTASKASTPTKAAAPMKSVGSPRSVTAHAAADLDELSQPRKESPSPQQQQPKKAPTTNTNKKRISKKPKAQTSKEKTKTKTNTKTNSANTNTEISKSAEKPNEEEQQVKSPSSKSPRKQSPSQSSSKKSKAKQTKNRSKAAQKKPQEEQKVKEQKQEEEESTKQKSSPEDSFTPLPKVSEEETETEAEEEQNEESPSKESMAEESSNDVHVRTHRRSSNSFPRPPTPIPPLAQAQAQPPPSRKQLRRIKSPNINVAKVIQSTTGFGYAMNIYIGPSLNVRTYRKSIRLPYDNMMVSPQPQNPLPPKRSPWTINLNIAMSMSLSNSSIHHKLYGDPQSMKFAAQVDGRILTVTRIDSKQGWNIPLQLKAYYAQESLHTHQPLFAMSVKGEGSAVTIRLKPRQRIRCVPGALIYKDENVKVTDRSVGMMVDSGSLLGGGGHPLHREGSWGKKKGLNYVDQAGRNGDAGGRQSPKREQGPHDDNSIHSIAEYTYFPESSSPNGNGNGKDHHHPKSNNRTNAPDIFGGIFTIGGQFPTKVLHLSLGEYGNRILFRSGTFLASSVDVHMVENPSDSYYSYSAHTPSFQYLVGYGEAFLLTGFAVKKFVLREDEYTVVRENYLVAFTQDVTTRLEPMQKLKKGMGIMGGKKKGRPGVWRTLIGPGLIWMNSSRKSFLDEDDFEDIMDESEDGSNMDLNAGSSAGNHRAGMGGGGRRNGLADLEDESVFSVDTEYHQHDKDMEEGIHMARLLLERAQSSKSTPVRDNLQRYDRSISWKADDFGFEK